MTNEKAMKNRMTLDQDVIRITDGFERAIADQGYSAQTVTQYRKSADALILALDQAGIDHSSLNDDLAETLIRRLSAKASPSDQNTPNTGSNASETF